MRLRFRLLFVAALLLAGYGLWIAVVRNLPLFQVDSVSVSGLSGDAAPQIAGALELAAREMTTTNVSVSRLRAAVAGYTAVEALHVQTSFPHGLRIEVTQRTPLARLDYGGTIVAVSRDDDVLAGIAPPRSLPLIRTTRAPLAGRVVDPLAREELALVAAAPTALRLRVYSVTIGSEGLTVRLRGGPLVYFGNAELPHAKWDSAAAVLATASARGASYIDVSLPSRPAAQVANPATSAQAAGSALSATLEPAGHTTGSSSTSG